MIVCIYIYQDLVKAGCEFFTGLFGDICSAVAKTRGNHCAIRGFA